MRRRRGIAPSGAGEGAQRPSSAPKAEWNWHNSTTADAQSARVSLEDLIGMITMRYGQRAIVALFAVAVNGCALIGIDRIPPEVSRFPSLAGKFAARFAVAAADAPTQLH